MNSNHHLGLGMFALVGVALALMREAPAQCAWPTTRLATPSGISFGASVAIDGPRALIGAPAESIVAPEFGAAHLFELQAGWSEVKSLSPTAPPASGRFGSSVALGGDTAFVGAPTLALFGGTVHVFERDHGGPGNWGESQVLFASDTAMVGLFGSALALSHDTLLVGAYYTDGVAGRAYLFRRLSTSSWTQVKVLVPSQPGGLRYFGASVALRDDLAIVGATRDIGANGIATGAAYVYQRDAGGPDQWGEVARLLAPDGAADDRFGSSVAIGPGVAVVGSPQDADLGYNAGSSYVFERDALGHWLLRRKLLASDGGFTAAFGGSLSLLGDELLIGARGAGVLGQAYVFERDFGGPGQWGQRELLQPGPQPVIAWFYGCAVAQSPGQRLIGAHDQWASGSEGAAYVSVSPNAISVACEPAASTSECRASLTVIGCASASNAGSFRVLAHGGDGRRLGMLFYALSASTAKPWGTSIGALCLQAPLQRTVLRAGSGTPGECDGSLELDWGAFASSRSTALGQPFVTGQTLHMQAIWRDAHTSRHTSLSNALQFTFTP